MSVLANCKDGTIWAIVALSQSGGTLHLDLFGKFVFSKCSVSCMETWRSYEIVRHCRRRVFFCGCLYWTVNNFIVSEHIEIACFLSLCLYRAESSIGQHARTSGSVQEWVHVLLFISRTSRANPVFKLTNRSHVAVHLFSNRSQMTSKC